MKLLIKSDSSHYPGVTIFAEQREMILLGEYLKAGAETKTMGVVLVEDVSSEGVPYEWIKFQIVKSIEDARKELKRQEPPIKLIITVLILLFVALCYLAFRGLSTF